MAARSEADRAAVTAAMSTALGDRPRIATDALAEAREALAAGAVPLSTLERFRRVRTAIDDGWRAFVGVQVQLAASRLAVARTDAESLVAYPGGAALYADASLRLGAVLSHQGRTSDAQAALALALALDPERPITLAEFSPDIIEAVDAVRAVRAQPRPTRHLHITSDPPGARIALDTKDVGRAPLDLDVPIGQHVVVAHLPLHEPRALALAVDETSTDVELSLTRDLAATHLAAGAPLGLPDADAHALVDATLRYANLDELVLVASTQRRGGPALLVQRCAGSPARCTAQVEVGDPDASGLPAAARETWQTARSADLRYPPTVLGAAAENTGPVDEHCKLCRSPILWGSVGAAALIGTIVIIAVVSGSQPPPAVGVDPSQY